VARVIFRANRQHGELVAEVPDGTTLLGTAKQAGAAMGDACGGNCACSTCHCWVLSGAENLSEQEDREADRLDMAFDVRPQSRLGCQSRVTGGPVVVEITPESLDSFENEHPESRRRP
jgi:2Fe-2S ferredoxin